MKKDDSERLINAIPDCNRRLSQCNDIIMRNMASTEIECPLLTQGIKDLEVESTQPEFWDDTNAAQETMGRLNTLKAKLDRVESWTRSCEDIETILGMIQDDPESARGIPF